MANYKVAHLVRRGGVYYFRAAVPRALLSQFGRRELRISLQTCDPEAARVRCREWSSRFERLIVRVKRMSRPTRHQVNELIRDYFKREMSVAAELVLMGAEDPQFDPEAEIAGAGEDQKKLYGHIAKREYDPFTRKEAAELLKAIGMPNLPEVSEEFDALCNGILRARAEQRRIFIAMLEGRYDLTESADPLFKGVSWEACPAPGDSISVEGETVSGLAQKYLSLKSAHDWVPKTHNENRRVLEWFAEIAGATKAIKAVTLEDVRDFRDALLKLPANRTKSKKFAGKRLAEILKAADGEAALAIKTSRKYYDNLRAFLNWCVDEGYLEKTPAHKLKITAKTNALDARHPFSAQQLIKLFVSPQYTGHKSETMRAKPGGMVVKDGKYWIPLVGLYTGMRLGEIVQLLVTDIKQQGSVSYFDVSRGEGEQKQLKTASSQRAVPIHPTLIKLGFLDHVEKSRTLNPKGRVFPDIEPGSDGYFSHNFSKFFSRYSRQIGIKTPRTAFHSFRHNFKDALVKANVEDSRIKALLGHSDKSVTAGYGSKMSPELLHSDVAKIDYGLSLDHLIPKSAIAK